MTFDGTTVTFIVVVANIQQRHPVAHPLGRRGNQRPVRVDFFYGPVTSIQQGTLAQGSFTAADVRAASGSTRSSTSCARATRTSAMHSQTYPAGEMRADAV